jgi:hypothetical protein
VIPIRVEDETGATIVPEQSWPAIPAAGSVVEWQETFRVTSDAPRWEFKSLPNQRCPRWVAVLTARPVEPASAADTEESV